MTTPTFDEALPKSTELTFSFPDFASACKKSFHRFILEIQSILESHDQTGHVHFRP